MGSDSQPASQMLHRQTPRCETARYYTRRQSARSSRTKPLIAYCLLGIEPASLKPGLDPHLYGVSHSSYLQPSESLTPSVFNSFVRITHTTARSLSKLQTRSSIIIKNAPLAKTLSPSYRSSSLVPAAVLFGGDRSNVAYSG